MTAGRENSIPQRRPARAGMRPPEQKPRRAASPSENVRRENPSNKRNGSGSWLKRNSVFIITLLAVIATVIALSFVIRDMADSRNYDRYMESARDRIISGDYDSALSSLRKAATVDATDDCLLLMAQCYESLGKYDKAILALRSMSSTSTAVMTKIASIESAKQQSSTAGTVTVAGSSFSVTETSLALDSRSLVNADISDLSKMYSLSSLSLAGNFISDISPLASLAGLTSLNLNGNQVENLTPISSLSALRTLYLDGNPIKDFSPLYSLRSLTSLSIKGIDISSSQLEELAAALPGCAINGANAAEENQFIALGGITFDRNVRELDLSGRGITEVSSLSQCSELTTLNISGNDISDISPLMDIPNLTELNIAHNSVADLRPLMGISSLKVLNASYNCISSTVPLSSNSGLTELDLSNNQITNFSGLRKLKNLVGLNLSGTGFQPADVQYFTYLSRLLSLNLENNPALTAETFRELQSMIPVCSIRHSELQPDIRASVNGMDFEKATTDIDLTGQGIDDLSFIQWLGNVQCLRLAANNITNIYYFQFTESARTLTYLDLSRNYISDITAVASLRNLVFLNLSDNIITDITPLYSMTSLRELYIGGNPLTDQQIYELNAYLPDCEIVFR